MLLGPGLTIQKGPFKYDKNKRHYKGQNLSGNANRDQWMHPQMFPFHPVQPSLPTPTQMSSIVEPFNPEQIRQSHVAGRRRANVRDVGKQTVDHGVQAPGATNSGTQTEPGNNLPHQGQPVATVSEAYPTPAAQDNDVPDRPAGNMVVHNHTTVNHQYQMNSEEALASLQSQQVQFIHSITQEFLKHEARQTQQRNLDMLDYFKSRETDKLQVVKYNNAEHEIRRLQAELESTRATGRMVEQQRDEGIRQGSELLRKGMNELNATRSALHHATQEGEALSDVVLMEREEALQNNQAQLAVMEHLLSQLQAGSQAYNDLAQQNAQYREGIRKYWEYLRDQRQQSYQGNSRQIESGNLIEQAMDTAHMERKSIQQTPTDLMSEGETVGLGIRAAEEDDSSRKLVRGVNDERRIAKHKGKKFN
jgi:hypothetical protein